MSTDSNDDVLDVLVLGAGAAGLFAAAESAFAGAHTRLLEKNRKPGVKILASGGTHCNVTSTLPTDLLLAAFGRRGARFLKPAIHALGPAAVRQILKVEGVPTAEYPLEKVFPVSGRAADVLEAFLRRLRSSGAQLSTGSSVSSLQNDRGLFVAETPSGSVRSRALIVACGGASYPRTGCTGDGYRWLRTFGHTITPPRPALVPILTEESWPRELSGVAVEAPVVRVVDGQRRVIFERRRPLLFTHRGLSGPGPMDMSRYLNDPDHPDYRLVVDWLPDLDSESFDRQLDARHAGSSFVAALGDELPRRLLSALFRRRGIPLDRRVAHLSRQERRDLWLLLKECEIPVSGDEGFSRAEVTAGGVALEEVDPKTMHSRHVPGLFLAGEILDLDGPIGGFNFQAAFSTGFVAGRAAAAYSRQAATRSSS